MSGLSFRSEVLKGFGMTSGGTVKSIGSNTSIQQVPDVDAAIGLACTYVATHMPFGLHRADRLIGSIAGQVRRRHYAFAARNGIVVGYCGWALCSSDVAKAWLESGQVPTFEQCDQGDVVVLIIAIADEKSALRQLVAYMRKLYGGKQYIGIRSSRGASVVKTGIIGLS